MSKAIYRRIGTAAVLAILVGCQTGMKSSLVAKADALKPELGTAATPVQQPAPSATPLAKATDTERPGPQTRTAYFRADTKPAAMPRVQMSKADEAVCKVKVGDRMPVMVLSKLGDDSNKTKLSDLYGKKGTVVVFWKGDRRMSQQQLADVGREIVEPFNKTGLAVVGVAVDKSTKDAENALKKANAKIPNLHDADGKAFAKIGTGRFPRTYVLDPSGKILWFDIEYSLATRRELHQALEAITSSK